MFFSPFSIAIISLEEKASLGAFRTFIRFALVWFYLFPLPLDVWEGLRFVIVALPGLFSYPFFIRGVCFVIIYFSSGTSGGLCFVTGAFSGYLHLYFVHNLFLLYYCKNSLFNTWSVDEG